MIITHTVAILFFWFKYHGCTCTWWKYRKRTFNIKTYTTLKYQKKKKKRLAFLLEM